MKSMIDGKKIHLVAATLVDRRRIYEWCFQSETTKSHSGPPDYPEKPIASYQDFCSDYYEEYFFTGAQPKKGQGFLIMTKEEAIGFISYSAFHLKQNYAELDIWMKDEASCGHGYGNDAILALSDYLNQYLAIDQLIIAPSNRNVRAIRSYEKAGFERTDAEMKEFLAEEYTSLYGEGDYGIGETAILIKDFEN
ncbi:GNAT family N-acetyltransferase [Enterococcus sp.]|uniref:GNAT family N-acetyltransferase n=1 Tax=Enterococcus sp. TaxID=35783 RepID=UPI0029155FB5|nr:GNAT family N-acetyltransferase [Enterococcus sp.]MDU5337073.1 GNAT family N-acetyltransferase [Enterococcus sp.]